MHLFSKNRFLAAQFIALLTDDLWLHNARAANSMAAVLEKKVSAVAGVQLAAPRETNVVFARIPSAWLPDLAQKTPRFHVWNSKDAVVRWMTSFDTGEAELDLLLSNVQACGGD